MKRLIISFFIIALFVIIPLGDALASPGFYPTGTTLKNVNRIERSSRNNRYHRGNAFQFAWGARLAYAFPTGDWNKHPYEPIDLYGSAIGFDVEAGGWQDQVGYFLVFGGNRFDTAEYERYVSHHDGQAFDEDAGMLNLRIEIKSRIPTTSQVTPIFKAGFGYYFLDSNTTYRTDQNYYRYDYFNDNWGFNVGAELMLRNTAGPRLYLSAEFINIFDTIRMSMDENDITMFKLGIGVAFINP